MLHFAISITGQAPASTAPLAVQFDEALTALAALPRMFIEPDGSFVWTGGIDDGTRWQVDGNLIDRGDVLAWVDVSGTCPEERFDEFLRALGWPAAPLAFELTRSGRTLEEAAFREQARSPAGAA